MCRAIGFFGVFDGHDGDESSKFLQAVIPNVFTRVCNTFQLHETEDIGTAMPRLLHEVYAQTEMKLVSYLLKNKHFSGSTGITCTVGEDPDGQRHLFCSNVGDSRAVLSRAGKAVPLSNDHKVSFGDERQRILDAGGWICQSDRIHGVINLARTFGDLEYKVLKEKSWDKEFKGDLIIATPEVHHCLLQARDDFVVMASDGIFDVMSDQTVVNFVSKHLDKEPDLKACTEKLIQFAIQGQNSRDNCCAIIVFLGKTSMHAPEGP